MVFWPSDSQVVVLDMETKQYPIQKEWTLEFYLKINSVSDVRRTHAAIKVLSQSSACTNKGAKFDYL